MNRIFLYILTLIVHYLIAFTWILFTGVIGFIVMVSHWILFNWCCSLTYIEVYIHRKLVGKTWYDPVKPFENSLFYRIINYKKK